MNILICILLFEMYVWIFLEFFKFIIYNVVRVRGKL